MTSYSSDGHSPPTRWRPVVGGLIVGVLLMCLTQAWAENILSFVRDGLAPGQSVVAATVPQVVSASRSLEVESADTSWQRQARYWQAEAARLKSELAELQQVPQWPEAALSKPLVQPRLRSARVIGWERPGLADWPIAVIRAGSTNRVHVDDIVVAPGDLILDQGQTGQIAADDLVLAGRTVIGRISRTSRWTSTIQPITDPAFRGQAQIVRLQDGEAILGAEGILSGSTRGSSSGGCQLLHIGTTEPVAEGDLVFTSLRGVPLSPPLFYGTITCAELVSGEPDWSIDVQPARQGPPPSEVLVLELSVSRERKPVGTP